MADLFFRERAVVLGEFDRGHDHARRAEAALQTMFVPKCLLHGVQRAIAGQAFDRGDRAAIDLNVDHLAVDGGRLVQSDHVGGSHRPRHHMVGEDVSELLLVLRLEQVLDSPRRQLRESFVRGARCASAVETLEPKPNEPMDHAYVPTIGHAIALAYQYRYNQDWRFTSTFNWDADQSETRSGSAMWHYQPADNPNKIVNIGYRYRNDTMRYDQVSGEWTYGSDFGRPGQDNYIKDYYKIDQHDFSFIWPVVPQWSVIGRWQHDYSRSRTLEAFGGFEYDSCCWKLRVINRYWIDYDETDLNPDVNDEPDTGIFLQIVFKGLGNVFGGATETFLDEGIQGYRERENQAF